MLGVSALIFLDVWSMPSKEQVNAEFLREYSSYQVREVYVGEGDGDSAYFHIKYQKPQDPQVYEVQWLYLETEPGKWTRQWRSDRE
jgi:hypothetical protein